MRLPPDSALLLWVAFRLVPAHMREDWRREWDAELWWWLASAPDPSRAALLGHCWGALTDAFCLRTQERPAADFQTPSMRLAAPLLLLALVAVFSGGFHKTRHALFALPPARLVVINQTGPFMGKLMPIPRQLPAWTANSPTIESVRLANPLTAFASLKPGVQPLQAQAELRQHSGFLTVTPYANTMVWPITVLGAPFLALALVAVLYWVRAGAPRAFTLAQPLAWLTSVFVAAIEMPVSPAALFVPFLIASFLALRFCWRDQRQRCPVCLHRLAMPVLIGFGPRSPFEPAGTEFLCPSGHGALFVTRETEPESHWTPLVA